MPENHTINPIPVITLGILMLFGLFVEASVNMSHTAHAVFEVLWIGIFGTLIILVIVLSTWQTQAETSEKSSVSSNSQRLTILEQPAPVQDIKMMLDIQTMTEVFRKYHQKND